MPDLAHALTGHFIRYLLNHLVTQTQWAAAAWTKMPFLSERSEEKRQVQMRKTKVTQITNRSNWGMQSSISESPRCPALEMGCSCRRPLWCPSCRLRTGTRGYNSHRRTPIGQQKIGKTCPGLMRLRVQMVRAECGVNNMGAWIHPTSYQCFRLLLMV